MKDNMITYHKVLETDCYGRGRWKYIPLKLTGRWSLRREVGNDEYDLYLEYKGWFFRHWIHEDDVVIEQASHEEIFECGGGEE